MREKKKDEERLYPERAEHVFTEFFFFFGFLLFIDTRRLDCTNATTHSILNLAASLSPLLFL